MTKATIKVSKPVDGSKVAQTPAEAVGVSEESLKKGQEAVQRILNGLRGSDFPADCGTYAMSKLSEFKFDMAVDIARVIEGKETP